MYIVVLNFSCSAKDREGHPEHAVHLQSTTYITQGCTSACARICIVATGRRWVVSKTETFSGERWLEAVCSSPRKNTTVVPLSGRNAGRYRFFYSSKKGIFPRHYRLSMTFKYSGPIVTLFMTRLLLAVYIFNRKDNDQR